MITAIQNKIKKIRQRPVGPKREAELQFFSSVADHCEYMKDIWRNELSHTRRWYKKEEALSAINRVKEFVTVIGEHKGSPIAGDTISKLIDQVIEREKGQIRRRPGLSKTNSRQSESVTGPIILGTQGRCHD